MKTALENGFYLFIYESFEVVKKNRYCAMPMSKLYENLLGVYAVVCCGYNDI